MLLQSPAVKKCNILGRYLLWNLLRAWFNSNKTQFPATHPSSTTCTPAATHCKPPLPPASPAFPSSSSFCRCNHNPPREPLTLRHLYQALDSEREARARAQRQAEIAAARAAERRQTAPPPPKLDEFIRLTQLLRCNPAIYSYPDALAV